MVFRAAILSDAVAIRDLVGYYAERGRMLHRSLESVYDHLRDFIVAVDEGRLVGCVAVDVSVEDLAEIKSLAVVADLRRSGVGRRLIAAAVADAKRLGVRRLFALTYEAEFFAAQGFSRIDRMTLPAKVWRECVACPKVDACDEIAMIRMLDELP
ncbi:MAG: N-acetyltransferase [Planctomycetaceae bacterium]|nr:N-acetyltransferase [Planctomycetaceae bacterium]